MTTTRISRRTFGALSAGALTAGWLGTSRTAAQNATPVAGFPRTITHILGESVVAAEPKRVVSVTDFNDLDYVGVLGVTPVLFGFTNAWDSGNMPWQTFAADVPFYDASAEFDLEQITAAKPDLIVGMAYVEEVYDKLSQIAPTIVLGWDTPPDEGLRMVGSALGRDAEAETQIASIETMLADARAQLGPLAGKTVRVGFQYGDTFYVWGPDALGAQTLAKLGLTFLGGDDPVLAASSLERVNELGDADLLISMNSDPASIAVQEASPLFQSLPVVKNGGYGVLSVVEGRAIGDGLSPLSLAWVLPQLIDFLSALGNGEGKQLG